MKIGHDNDVTNHKGTIYVESDTELSWSIKSSVDCDKKQIRQLQDLSYRCGLCQKMTLSYHDRSD